MTNHPWPSAQSPLMDFQITCPIPCRAVEPILSLIESFGARPANINGAGIAVRSLPEHLAEIFEACVRQIVGASPETPTEQIYLF